MASERTAVVTGASSGIGAATAVALAHAGFHVVVGARRIDRLEQVAEPIGATALRLDVTDAASVAAFCEQVPECSVLVNNAGGALGLTPVVEADEEQWRWMYDVNVLGTMRMTKALLPALERGAPSHIVNVGSIAGLEVYDGGGGYTAAKHALRAVTQTLRIELLGRPIRITEVDPGMVETEFSVVRFGGDEERAAQLYAGLTPLTAADVADVIAYAVTRPAHVNVDQVVLKPLAQAAAQRVHRE
ncbi:MAG TPA: SDR family NAD(P)-dependent oxidoreductase [Acidimicrobiales bacterium]|nr:SDR family NAD(P)-dependent oxidoreductase [Acidimicrobiales bacterium]